MLVCAALWLVLAPISTWLPLPHQGTAELHLTVATSGESMAPNERALGLLNLRGVPANMDEEAGHDSLSIGWLNATKETKPQDYPMLAPSRSSTAYSAPGWLNPFPRGRDPIRRSP